METTLAGVGVVTLAPNVPGPAAAARLRALGATVVKVEPLEGDPLEAFAPAWYAHLHRDTRVVRLDLKALDGREQLEHRLAQADVLLTSSRPSALERLGLAWEALHARHPRLAQVAIVGEAPPDAERPGHDLTYLAALGVLEPPNLPRTLMADLAGAERAAALALALLLRREREGRAALAYVALAEVARELAAPFAHGLTTAAGVLGGAFAGYRFYRARDGWIAVAALEPRFWERLCSELGVNASDLSPQLDFRARDAREWERWARERDLPIVAVP